MAIDPNEKLEIDAPKCSPLEADTLFYHHLMLACTYFELLPDDHEFNTTIFSSLGRQSIWLEACENFYNKLHKTYQDVEDFY
jgi:hypothetical protein